MAKKKIFDRFSQKSIDKRDEHGLTKLYRAARHGNLNIVRELLKKGANPNIASDCGLSPLHIAAFWGETKIVKVLLEHDADPNIDNGKGWTPLHSASLNYGLPERPEVIALLKEYHAKEDVQDAHGWSPQDYADLWKDFNIHKLRDVFEQLKQDDDHYPDHQPNMKSLNLDKKGSDNDDNKDKKPSCPPPHRLAPHKPPPPAA